MAAYQPNDYYARKARSENFVARSVYKLEEIDKRWTIFEGVQYVIDLGASPGSWTQYCLQKIRRSGMVFAIDLQPIKCDSPQLFFLKGDIHQLSEFNDLPEWVCYHGFDLVLSDMAPKTTGVKVTDQARSVQLCETALDIAIQYLKPTGKFVCKMFDNPESQDFKKQLLQSFKKVYILRPKSTRKESKEIFFVATDYQLSE